MAAGRGSECPGDTLGTVRLIVKPSEMSSFLLPGGKPTVHHQYLIQLHFQQLLSALPLSQAPVLLTRQPAVNRQGGPHWAKLWGHRVVGEHVCPTRGPGEGFT